MTLMPIGLVLTCLPSYLPTYHGVDLFLSKIMDQLIVTAGELRVRLVLPFVDQWEWVGVRGIACVAVPNGMEGVQASSVTFHYYHILADRVSRASRASGASVTTWRTTFGRTPACVRTFWCVQRFSMPWTRSPSIDQLTERIYTHVHEREHRVWSGWW